MTLLTQPLSVDTDFVKKGLGRRYIILPYVAPLATKFDIQFERLKGNNETKSVEGFTSIIRTLVRKCDIEFNTEAIDFIVSESQKLAKELMGLNDRAEGYVRIIAIDIENTLLKMAAIATRLRDPQSKVTKEDCEAVKEDWQMLYKSTTEYILTYILGDFTYSGLSGKEIICLRLLENCVLENCVDEKSGIKPIEYCEKIAKKFDIEKDTARKQYYDELKKRHLIETKGGKEPKVWLSIEGKKTLEFGISGSKDDQE